MTSTLIIILLLVALVALIGYREWRAVHAERRWHLFLTKVEAQLGTAETAQTLRDLTAQIEAWRTPTTSHFTIPVKVDPFAGLTPVTLRLMDRDGVTLQHEMHCAPKARRHEVVWQGARYTAHRLDPVTGIWTYRELAG